MADLARLGDTYLFVASLMQPVIGILNLIGNEIAMVDFDVEGMPKRVGCGRHCQDELNLVVEGLNRDNDPRVAPLLFLANAVRLSPEDMSRFDR